MTYIPMAQRAICPGCGAALDLEDNATLIDCPFCGTKSRIVRQLRRAEPRFSWELIQPEKEPDVGIPPNQWSFEELLYSLNTGDQPELTQEILQAMDTWQRVGERNLKWLPPLMNSLRHLPEDISIKAAGIIGKFLCSDDTDLRHKVLDMLPEFLFLPKGCTALTKAAALADAAAVRMLLDTATDACKKGDEEYAQQALYGVQTAIGRERNERKVAVCILLHKLFEFEDFIAKWALKFLRNQYDIGYTDLLGETLEAYDDALEERPDLASEFLPALRKCRRPKDSDDLKLRLSAFRQLRNQEAREEALKLIVPTYPLTIEDTDVVMESLCLLAQDNLVAQSLAKFVWECKAIKPAHLATLESLRPLPQALERALEHFNEAS